MFLRKQQVATGVPGVFPTPVLWPQLRSADRSDGQRSGVCPWFQRMGDLPPYLRLGSRSHLRMLKELCGCFATALGGGVYVTSFGVLRSDSLILCSRASSVPVLVEIERKEPNSPNKAGEATTVLETIFLACLQKTCN